MISVYCFHHLLKPYGWLEGWTIDNKHIASSHVKGFSLGFRVIKDYKFLVLFFEE